jgi:hypothetical protein
MAMMVSSQRLDISPKISTPVKKPVKQTHLSEIENLRMEKRRLSKLKIPPKYERIVEALILNSLEVVDLTNAELGDSAVLQICKNIGSKVRSLKLIRNRLTDEGISKLTALFSTITTLNLSCNQLTSNVLDILYDNRNLLPQLKTIVLSQNKIIEKKNTVKIERIKKLDWSIVV